MNDVPAGRYEAHPRMSSFCVRLASFMPDDHDAETTLLRQKDYEQPSAFTPENLLREARRQKALSEKSVPEVCLLDPDGDIVRHLKATGAARRNPHWPGYHTTLYDFDLDGRTVGVVGCAVGASFAILVAEQLFASGCRLLASVTSSGQIVPQGAPPYFVLIEKALRDEGTSRHYRPPADDYARLRPALRESLREAFDDCPQPVHPGAVWTTDAPFRETEAAIAAAEQAGLLAVEMEASALYAFAEARERPVVCLAHVTNQMATVEGDFEKGEADGSHAALRVVAAVAHALAPLEASSRNGSPLPGE